MLAFALALCLSSFTSTKKAGPFTLYSFVFTGFVTCADEITQTDVGHTTYSNWTYDVGSYQYCLHSASEMACSITVSGIFTHTNNQGRILLNASDPDGNLGPKLAFPMLLQIGFIWDDLGLTFYKLNDLIQIPGVLLIDNGAVGL